MPAYETTATIESGGELRLSDVPFEPGTQVEVFVLPKRSSAQSLTRSLETVDLNFPVSLDGYRLPQCLQFRGNY